MEGYYSSFPPAAGYEEQVCNQTVSKHSCTHRHSLMHSQVLSRCNSQGKTYTIPPGRTSAILTWWPPYLWASGTDPNSTFPPLTNSRKSDDPLTDISRSKIFSRTSWRKKVILEYDQNVSGNEHVSLQISPLKDISQYVLNALFKLFIEKMLHNK